MSIRSPMNFDLFKRADEISKDLLSCIKRGDKLIAIPLSIRRGTEKTGHANMLIYRPFKHTIERFEPHGQEFAYNKEKEDESINKTLKRMFEVEMKPYLKDFTPKFITPMEVCPIETGFQGLEGLTKKLEQEGGGFCGMWSLFCLEMMFINPEKTTKEIIGEAFKITKEDPQYLANLIRGYVVKTEKLVDTYIKSIDKNDGFSFSNIKGLHDKKDKIQNNLLNLLLTFDTEHSQIKGLKEIKEKFDIKKEKRDKYEKLRALLMTKSQKDLNVMLKATTGKQFGVRNVLKMTVESIVNYIIDKDIPKDSSLPQKIFKYYNVNEMEGSGIKKICRCKGISKCGGFLIRNVIEELPAPNTIEKIIQQYPAR